MTKKARNRLKAYLVLPHEGVEETHHQQHVVVLFVINHKTQFLKVERDSSLGNIATITFVELDLSCSRDWLEDVLVLFGDMFGFGDKVHEYLQCILFAPSGKRTRVCVPVYGQRVQRGELFLTFHSFGWRESTKKIIERKIVTRVRPRK